MTLIKLFEMIRPLVKPFYNIHDTPNYKVMCNGETVTGGQIILKTYKRKTKEMEEE